MTKIMCRAFNRSSRNEFVKNGYYLNTGDMYIIQYVCMCVCMYELLHKIMINMCSMKYYRLSIQLWVISVDFDEFVSRAFVGFIAV